MNAKLNKCYQPNRGSTSKEHPYYFVALPIDNVATSDIALHLPIDSPGPDRLTLPKSACTLFAVRSDKSITTSIREIFYCDIHREKLLPLTDDMYYLKIIGDGFLKYMIRYLMSALFELAEGRITLDYIGLYLQQYQHCILPIRQD